MDLDLLELEMEMEQKRREFDFRERCPLDREDYLEMLDYVAEGLKTRGNHSDFRYMREWVQTTDIPEHELIEFMDEEAIQDDFWLCMKDPYELFGCTEDRLAWMPIEHRDLCALKRWLSRELPSRGCDCELTMTKEWLEERGLPVYSTMMALLAQGGGCDCEILMNVESAKIYPGLGSPRSIEDKVFNGEPDPDLMAAEGEQEEWEQWLESIPDRNKLN